LTSYALAERFPPTTAARRSVPARAYQERGARRVGRSARRPIHGARSTGLL